MSEHKPIYSVRSHRTARTQTIAVQEKNPLVFLVSQKDTYGIKAGSILHTDDRVYMVTNMRGYMEDEICGGPFYLVRCKAEFGLSVEELHDILDELKTYDPGRYSSRAAGYAVAMHVLEAVVADSPLLFEVLGSLLSLPDDR